MGSRLNIQTDIRFPGPPEFGHDHEQEPNARLGSIANQLQQALQHVKSQNPLGIFDTHEIAGDNNFGCPTQQGSIQ